MRPLPCLHCALLIALLALTACDDGEPATETPRDGAVGDQGVDARAQDARAQDAGPNDAEPIDADPGLDLDRGPDAGPGGACPGPSPTGPTEVVTTEGLVRGVALADGVTGFFGLPFAAPPVGDLRFVAPAPPACHAEPFAADTFGPACVQLDGDGLQGSEDCLTLNVWRPDPQAFPGPRPVLFFIHGGGNIQGSAVQGAGRQLLYDGIHLARRQGVVVVTIQYRLGPLGWLVHPSLADAAGRSGNLGSQDQIAALRWFQANARAFRADPARVTVFGESAGARNVCVLVASPLATGLFAGSIMQSGACVVPSAEAVAADGAAQVAAAGCAEAADVAACLRAASLEDLWLRRPPTVDVAGGSGSQFQPYVDGWLLADQPDAVIARGEHNRGPFIAGANADEAAQTAPPVPDVAAYERLVRAQLGPFAAEALALYPVEDYPSPRDAYADLAGDAKFVCNARAAVRAAAEGGGPAYLYHFAQNLSRAPRLAAFGAFHGAELFFVFGSMDLAGYRAPPAELALSEAIGGYWARFARQGDPNGDGAVAWPAYTLEEDAHLLLVGDGIAAGAGLKQARCDFWQRISGR